MRRQLSAELLDTLPAFDPRARHSRRDLVRINRLMGNARFVARALQPLVTAPSPARPVSIVELGGGDGTFLLDVARRIGSGLGRVHATLVDRQALVTDGTRERLRQLSWHIDPVESDVFTWLACRTRPDVDVTIANLFLHHFEDGPLARLLGDAARATRLFVAAEPYRARFPLAAASLLSAIGCNDVTVHDGQISVRAGFLGQELSALWPRDPHWTLRENRSGLFTHAFAATRTAP